MAWTDTKCGRIVQGRDQHCPACHHTFTSTAAGDLHRTGPHDNRRCTNPAWLASDAADDHGQPLLEYDPNRDAWRIPLTDARRAALNKLHAM